MSTFQDMDSLRSIRIGYLIVQRNFLLNAFGMVISVKTQPKLIKKPVNGQEGLSDEEEEREPHVKILLVTLNVIEQ